MPDLPFVLLQHATREETDALEQPEEATQQISSLEESGVHWDHDDAGPGLPASVSQRLLPMFLMNLSKCVEPGSCPGSPVHTHGPCQ